MNYRAPRGADLIGGWHVQISGDWNWKLDVYPHAPAPIARGSNACRVSTAAAAVQERALRLPPTGALEIIEVVRRGD